MKKIFILLTIIASLSIAFAAESPTGIYVGGHVGYGKINLTSTSTYTNTGFGYGIYGGYSFTRNIAAEFGYNNMPGYSVSSTTTNYYYLYAALRGTIPMQNGFNLFGKAGLAYADNNTYHRLVGYGSLGLGYELAQDFELNSFVAYTTKSATVIPSMFYGGIGLEYLFPV